jgi:hypothetical protein
VKLWSEWLQAADSKGSTVSQFHSFTEHIGGGGVKTGNREQGIGNRKARSEGARKAESEGARKAESEGARKAGNKGARKAGSEGLRD